MKAGHSILFPIALASVATCSFASEERGSLADYADAVYRLKGTLQTAIDVRDLCAASFPEYAADNLRSYEAWQAQEGRWIKEVESGYEFILRLKSGGDPLKRMELIEEDSVTSKRSDEMVRERLTSVPNEAFSASCAGYSNFLLGKNEADPFVSAQLQIIRRHRTSP